MNTTQNAPGSAPAGNPSGTAAPAPAAGNNGSPVINADANWLTGLQDADNRQIVATKGWDKSNSPDVVITSYRELESRLGKSVVLPTAESPKEDYDKLYTALGKPKTPGEYSLKLPAGVDPSFPYDDGFATEYKNWSHEADLSPRQAQTIHDKFVLRAQAQAVAHGQAMQAKVGTAHSQIIEKWGPEGSAGYKTNVAHAAAAVRSLGLSDTFKASGLLTQKGEIADAKLAFALCTIGEGLFKEDSSRGGDPGHMTTNNPWKDGQENLAEQGRIHRTNPELAKTLIVAAGKDPAKVLFKPK